MIGILEIDGIKLSPIKEAAAAVSYSRDYITRLARENKIVASYVGRQWYVSIDSLNKYIESVVLEKEIRKKKLSIERKRENILREVSKKKNKFTTKKARSLHVRAVATASLVLGFGLLSGVATHELFSVSKSSGLQTQNTQVAQVSKIPAEVSLAAASESDYISSGASEIVTTKLTQKLRPLGEIQNGILLLPNTPSSTVSVAGVFSDKVVVKNLPDGTQVVVRVDQAGNAIGNTIPFVVVPVEREEIEI
ncbi:MAG: excisionase family DNA binding protein [Candidatus Paceibacteria bacterium]|jgi:excisionase family DNA binding protein